MAGRILAKVLVPLDGSEPSSRIVAHEGGVGLVALATHGRTGLARSAFGSVADKVLRTCRSPLLVVRTA